MNTELARVGSHSLSYKNSLNCQNCTSSFYLPIPVGDRSDRIRKRQYEGERLRWSICTNSWTALCSVYSSIKTFGNEDFTKLKPAYRDC